MTRIDMSEYMEKHAVSRLVGSPPGYIGYEEGGQLTEAVRRKPYSVVLLDEVEKAHPDVFNILLQVLDDGRLTDNHGRTVSFRNAIVILTSNIGSQHLSAAAGAQGKTRRGAKTFSEAVRDAVTAELKATFRPEFLNRLDDTVLFHALGRDELRQIVKIQLEDFRKRLAEQELALEIDEAAVDAVAEAGFDPVYGARPVKRAIQREIETPVARAIIAGTYLPGATVRLTAKNGEVVVG